MFSGEIAFSSEAPLENDAPRKWSSNGQWKPIAGWEAYEVSTDGQVRRGEHVLKLDIHDRGYAYVRLFKTSIHRRHGLSRQSHNYRCVDHING